MMTGSMSLEAQRHDAGERGVEQPQADAFAGADRLVGRDDAVQRDRVADPSRHPGFHHVAEAGRDLALFVDAPVRQHPEHVAVDGDGLRLLDDQRAGEPAAELLQAVGMRVVPEGAGIGRRELVDERLAWPDRRLRQARNAVHGVRQPDAVPMHRRVLVEPVLDDDADGLALAKRRCGTGNSAVIGPDLGVAFPCHRNGGGAAVIRISRAAGGKARPGDVSAEKARQAPARITLLREMEELECMAPDHSSASR